MAKKKDYTDYAEFMNKIGFGKIDDVDITHDGYPLSVKESKFISEYVATGNMNKSLKSAGLLYKTIAGKEYIADEIKWRLDQLKKQTIADADEIMQYFTQVMRGEVNDQFGLDAPLAERTNAAKELARRVVDMPTEADLAVPEIKVTLNWDGLE